jgi:hypothetical protein
MDNQSVSLQVLSYSEGMSIVQDSILTWIFDPIRVYMLVLSATDGEKQEVKIVK